MISGQPAERVVPTPTSSCGFWWNLKVLHFKRSFECSSTLMKVMIVQRGSTSFISICVHIVMLQGILLLLSGKIMVRLEPLVFFFFLYFSIQRWRIKDSHWLAALICSQAWATPRTHIGVWEIKDRTWMHKAHKVGLQSVHQIHYKTPALNPFLQREKSMSQR